MVRKSKVVCSTSNKYLHLIQVFTYLFNKYFDAEQEVTILGYEKPSCLLPENFIFHSMGTQGPVNKWSTDLRKYFESIEETHILWVMEDCLFKSVDQDKLNEAYAFMMPGIGRIDLTRDVQKRPHSIDQFGVVTAAPDSRYRLSTQPSIWSKEFLLTYLTDGMSPWVFETQDPINDGWSIIGLKDAPVVHNEGVRKFDPHALDLNGFSGEDVEYIKSLL